WNGHRIVTAGEESIVRLWDGMTGKRIAQMSQRGIRIYCVGVSPNGKRIATGCLNNSTCYLWDAGTCRLAVPPLLHHGDVVQVKFSPDGRQLCSVCGDGNVYLWDAATGRQMV